MGRVIPGNGQPITTWVYGPDRQSVSLASSMAIANNTFSPMAVGVHAPPDRSPKGYTGDPGYGVNRFTGDTPPLQNFYGAVVPIAQAKSKRLGMGVGVSGQPGLPNTGDVDPYGSLTWALSKFGAAGMGGSS